MLMGRAPTSEPVAFLQASKKSRFTAARCSLPQAKAKRSGWPGAGPMPPMAAIARITNANRPAAPSFPL